MARWNHSGLIAVVAGSLGLLGAAPSNAGYASQAAPKPDHRPGFGAIFSSGHKVGLGKVVSTRDGGQIFGWDIDMAGTDGLLSSSQDTAEGYQVSVETFDQKTGKITSSFARYNGPRNSYLVDGIFTGDIGLVTHFIIPKGTIYAKRRYELMDPVTADHFTGPWAPPVRDFDVLENAENQSTSTSVVFGIELKKNDIPDLIATDLAEGTSTLIHLDPNAYGLADEPQLAQDTGLNSAVVAYSPDGGARGGAAPVNALFDLKSGKVTTFAGYNNGFSHAGVVNGIAVDSTTHVEATTTELNAQVEFYDLKKRTGITAVQLPGTGSEDQLNSGAAIANDPVNHLFLVADPDYAPTGGSAIVVYDEAGNLVEAITGFNFSNRYRVIPVRVAVNPALRMGWVDGPGDNQLQQFFY
jgi:hypothetical protein